MIAELFGKDEGYCRGRGGGMHIGDFSTGNLGANAIVGGSVPIATGAAMAHRYERSRPGRVLLRGRRRVRQRRRPRVAQLGGPGPVDEPPRRRPTPYGLPIIYFIQNNHYGMTHRTDDEVMGVRHLARRAAGFADDNMHAEVVNGMDVLAVRDAVRRAAALCRAGEGPVLIEASTYRYYGHSLSDPRNEYRTREEEAAWRAVDPIERLKRQLVDGGRRRRGRHRGHRGARPASATRGPRSARPQATDPDPADVLELPVHGHASPTSVPASAATRRHATPSRRSRSATPTARSATATRSARRSSRRCSATAGSSSTARTSPTTAARSS